MTSEDSQQFDVKTFALRLREDIEKNRIKLPTLPANSLEALLVVNDAGSSMADVARIISKDTSMAARLIRYANSPLYRGVHNVATVKAAITRIGIDAVKNALLSLAMRDVFRTAYKPIQTRMETLWQHSVAVAAKAAILSKHFPHFDSDQAMLAGLIHDIGVIPILLKAKDYPVLLEDEANLDRLIQMLHMSVGKFLLTHWQFAPGLVEVAANHDKLDREPPGPEVDYVDIVQVANILSYTGQRHQLSAIDRAQVLAFQRVGLDLIEAVEQQAAAEGSEMEISTLLH